MRQPNITGRWAQSALTDGHFGGSGFGSGLGSGFGAGLSAAGTSTLSITWTTACMGTQTHTHTHTAHRFKALNTVPCALYGNAQAPKHMRSRQKRMHCTQTGYMHPCMPQCARARVCVCHELTLCHELSSSRLHASCMPPCACVLANHA